MYDTGSGARVNRIMSNCYVYAHGFCTGFRKELLELIDDPEYVYMLGIAMLLDGTRRSMKFMEVAWSAELWHEWKQVTVQWARFKDFSNALKRGII